MLYTLLVSLYDEVLFRRVDECALYLDVLELSLVTQNFCYLFDGVLNLEVRHLFVELMVVLCQNRVVKDIVSEVVYKLGSLVDLAVVLD